MEAKITFAVQRLANVAIAKYRATHGGQAPAQEGHGDFGAIWAPAWTALQAAGATPGQEDDCRSAFIEIFYAMAPAGSTAADD